MNQNGVDRTQIEARVRDLVARAVAQAPVTDLHTHLYPPQFGSLMLWGIDELLTYHYLAAETLRASSVPYDAYWDLSTKEQADLVWQTLFVDRSPVSEACRGVLTVLSALGLDTSTRDLGAYREFFAGRDPKAHVTTVFDCARVNTAVMTNDPFDSREAAIWEQPFEGDPRFRAALRIDPLLNDWETVCAKLHGWGYKTVPALDTRARSEVRRFLSEWLKRMQALYMAVSLPPSFVYPDDSVRSRIITECVLPVAREHNVPFALMVGVKRRVNPALGLAGDGVGRSNVDSVARLCAAHPENKFMATMLARENQHELCVAARKFRNLFIFGCWWFLNNPSLIEEMTRMRIELLGLSFAPQHSDARVLEQVIYKWAHARVVLNQVLGDKYVDLATTGWAVTDAEVQRDVARLLGGNFWDFLKAS